MNEFVELKVKMYLLFEDDNSEHKKATKVNKNVVVTISHKEYRDVLLNKKCLKYSINSTQSNDHRIGTCFDDKIYIQNNGYGGLALGYYS